MLSLISIVICAFRADEIGTQPVAVGPSDKAAVTVRKAERKNGLPELCSRRLPLHDEGEIHVIFVDKGER